MAACSRRIRRQCGLIFEEFCPYPRGRCSELRVPSSRESRRQPTLTQHPTKVALVRCVGSLGNFGWCAIIGHLGEVDARGSAVHSSLKCRGLKAEIELRGSLE